MDGEIVKAETWRRYVGMAKGLALAAVWSCDCASLSSSVEWGGNSTYFTWVMWELNNYLCKILTWQINRKSKLSATRLMRNRKTRSSWRVLIGWVGWTLADRGIPCLLQEWAQLIAME